MKSRERNMAYCTRELCVTENMVSKMLTFFFWVEKIMLFMGKIIKEMFGLFYCFVLYVLGASVYFPHWTHTTIPREKHQFLHLDMGKGFRTYILYQIAPEMRIEHELTTLWLKNRYSFHLTALLCLPTMFSLPTWFLPAISSFPLTCFAFHLTPAYICHPPSHHLFYKDV